MLHDNAGCCPSVISDSVWEEFSLLNKTVDEQEITKILRRLDLLDYKDKHPMTLSGGQKQRLALAVATLANKDIMILMSRLAAWIMVT